MKRITVTIYRCLLLLVFFYCSTPYAGLDCSGPYEKQQITHDNFLHLVGQHQALLKELTNGKITFSSFLSDKRYLNLCGARVAFANSKAADFRHANFQSTHFANANFPESNFSQANLVDAHFKLANLNGANLSHAIANDANFSFVNFENANFYSAKLKGAKLDFSNLGNAVLSFSQLDNANLSDAYLVGASLNSASIRGALLFSADLSNADIARADLSHSVLQNAILTVSNVDLANFSQAKLGQAKGITSFPIGEESLYPLGLYELRNTLWTSGFKTESREINYLFRHHESHLALGGPLHEGGNGSQSSNSAYPFLVLQGAWKKLSALISIAAFDWTTKWGMVPSLALFELLIIIIVMAFVYWLGIRGNAHLFVTRPVTSQTLDGETYQEGEYHRIDIRSFIRTKSTSEFSYQLNLFYKALYFSFISSIQIGWKDLNLGTWVGRLQQQSYSFHAKGWLRTVSGIQSLVCIYLIAIWVLTEFTLFFEW